MLPILGLLTPVLNKVLDRVLPDEGAREKAKAEFLQLQADNEFRKVETQLSAIIAEANSEDPWTSRARPSFLYVVYFYILAAVPMGFVFAVDPESAKAVTEGVAAWLTAIPEQMWTLFGVGYLGYTGARSIDKRKK